MNQLFCFDPKLFQKVHQRKIIFFWFISAILYFFIFLSYRDFPSQPNFNDPSRMIIWKEVHIFFVIMTFLLFNFGSIYWYLSKKNQHKNGYIEIQDNIVIHVSENKKHTKQYVKRVIGFVSDEKKCFYAHIYKHQILKVDHVSLGKHGNLTINGIIELQIVDEMLDEEQGPNRENNMPIIKNKHCIPAYYENMPEIHQKILNMVHQDNSGKLI